MLEVLRASGAFGGLDERVLRDLGGFLELQFVPGGNIVYCEGDQANTMFFLISGRLRGFRAATRTVRSNSTTKYVREKASAKRV